MKKLVPILILVVILAFSAAFSFFYKKPKVEVFVNKPNDFQKFLGLNATPELKNFILYRLSAINCNPTEYTLKNNVLCTNCNGFSACFPLTLVKSVGNLEKVYSIGEKPYLTGSYSEEDARAFYSCGIYNFLGCENGTCKNGTITAYVKNNYTFFHFDSFKDANATLYNLLEAFNYNISSCKKSDEKIYQCPPSEYTKLYFDVIWEGDRNYAVYLG